MAIQAIQKIRERWRAVVSQSEYKIAFKACIAAILSYLGGYYSSLVLEHPNPSISTSWAVLSTFVVLQSSHLGGTYRAAWTQFLGTAIGAFTGSLFTTILGFHIVTLGISIFLTVIICSFLNMKQSIRIACMSATVVMLLWGLRPTISPWSFGFFRFVDSSIGILVAVVVAHAFWPAQAMSKLRFNLARTLYALRRYYRLSLNISPEPKHYPVISRRISREVVKLLEQSRQFLEDSKLEILTKTARTEVWSSMIDQLQKIFDALIVLDTTRNTNLEKIFDVSLEERLSKTIHATDMGFQHLIKMLKEGTKEDFTELTEAKDLLDEELTRFRSTHTTRKFNASEVERFFVFFFNLRTIIDEILRMSKKVMED